MNPKEPLFDFERCISPCDSCDKQTEASEEHHVIMTHRTGFGLVLCDDCMDKLKGALDELKEEKGVEV